MTHLIDTDICIALVNDRPERIRLRLDNLFASGAEAFVSAVTRFELQYGAGKSQRIQSDWNRLIVFFSRLKEIAFESGDADAAGAVRAVLEKAGPPMGAYDVLLAGQAMHRKLTLVTGNVREFRRVRGLRVENWLTGP